MALWAKENLGMKSRTLCFSSLLKFVNIYLNFSSIGRPVTFYDNLVLLSIWVAYPLIFKYVGSNYSLVLIFWLWNCFLQLIVSYDGWKMDEFIASEVEKVGNWLMLSPYVLVVFSPFPSLFFYFFLFWIGLRDGIPYVKFSIFQIQFSRDYDFSSSGQEYKELVFNKVQSFGLLFSW